MESKELPKSALPMQLLDIDGNRIPASFLDIPSKCFFVRSFQNFNIRITSGNARIYCARSVNNVEHEQSFYGATAFHSYTIFFEDENPVQVACSTIPFDKSIAPTTKSYTFQLRSQAIPEYYSDLLANNDLPQLIELEKAILIDDERPDLLKRLLLDFKHILKRKGTRQGIESFLEFIGLTHNQLTVSDEYKHMNADGTTSVTVTPNRMVDEKTGNYHVLFDNFIQHGYDSNNLPINQIIIHDLKDFYEKLISAIALANRYFTSKEQDITFFGLNYSVNMPMFPTITTSGCICIEENIHLFEKDIHIDLKNYADSKNYRYIVRNCLQKANDLYKSEIKIFRNDPNVFGNKEIFFIDEEIFDDTIIDDPTKLNKVQSIFAVAQHLNIAVNKAYVEVSIRSKVNMLSELRFEKAYVESALSLIFVSTLNGAYDVCIDVYDLHNNRERFNFTFDVSASTANIDFETFNSAIVLAEAENTISTDIESPASTLNVTTANQQNFILALDYVPLDLSQYFAYGNTDGLKYLTNTSRYIVPKINKNIVVNTISDTIPLKFIDSYLSILTFPYLADSTLKLRVVDPNTCKQLLIPFASIGSYSKALDKIFVNVVDITDGNGTATPYVFITTTESGLDLLKIWDFVYEHNTTKSIDSIKDRKVGEGYVYAAIPVNYDFPLFLKPSSLAPEFVGYASPSKHTTAVVLDTANPTVIQQAPVVQSLFPRLINIDKNPDPAQQTYYLKLGDIVACRINEKLVTNNYNLVWRVYNSFTKEKLFETADYMLKYRIDDNICYDIECEFLIGNTKHKIVKPSLFSSFNIKI